MTSRLTEGREKQRKYTETLAKLQSWLLDAESSMNTIKQEAGAPDGGDASGVQAQLDTVKLIAAQALSQAKTVDELRRSSDGMIQALRALGVDDVTLDEMRQNVVDIEERVDAVSGEASAKAHELQTALVQSQGIQDGVDNLLQYLQRTDDKLGSLRPVTLNMTNVSDELQEAQLLQADIASHRTAIDSLNDAVQQLRASGGDANTQRQLQQTLDAMNAQFDDVSERAQKRHDDVARVADKLATFNELATKHEEWLLPTLQFLEARETDDLPPDELKQKLTDAQNEARSRQTELQNLQELGQQLSDDASTRDASQVKDKLTQLRRQWEDWSEVMTERQKELAERDDQQSRYGDAKDDVIAWLSEMEARIERLEPVAIDVEVIEQQIDDLRVRRLPVQHRNIHYHM